MSRSKKVEEQHAQVEEVDSYDGPEFERVHWMREPHLRHLYAWACVLMIASATTGYDG
jgi:hypothetical protein